MAQQSGNKEKLIQAGLSLLSEKSSEDISMEEIAEKAGVTKPMVYYYFGNKEGFYQHLVQYALECLHTIIEDCLRTETTFRGVLIRIIKGRIDIITKNPALSNAVKIMAISKTIGGVESKKHVFQLFDKITPVFNKAIQTGEIEEETDLQLIMAMTNSLLDGAVQIHGKDFFNTVDPSNFAESLVRMVFDGIGKRKTI